MIPDGFQPLLSAKVPADWNKLSFPILVSPKLDGIRCLMFGGVAYSRKLKPIPNAYIQHCLNTLPDGFDGELIVGDPTGNDAMNRTASGVMSRDGEPDFTFHVFDWAREDMLALPFNKRIAALDGALSHYEHCSVVRQHVVSNPKDLSVIEGMYLSQGYEGVMIRDPDGPYKCGRSTTKEGILLKVKRFHDAEATIVGFVEGTHNTNQLERDERGYAKRSKAKDGLVGNGLLGAFVCRAILREDGEGYKDTPCVYSRDIEFELGNGPGLTLAQRAVFWEHRDKLRGKLVKFKYQDLTPDKSPRFPGFLGFRHEIDL